MDNFINQELLKNLNLTEFELVSEGEKINFLPLTETGIKANINATISLKKNFLQVDNKLDYKFNKLDEKIDYKFDELDKKIDSKFDLLNSKLDTQNKLIWWIIRLLTAGVVLPTIAYFAKTVFLK